MTATEAAGTPAAPLARDLRAATPVALVGGALCASAVAALGQLPPLLVNLTGAGLAVVTQVRLGWLYTMAGHAVAIQVDGLDATGDTTGEATVDLVVLRLGLLTITAAAVCLLALAARGSARRVDDWGSRRALAGSLVAIPYALLIGGVNVAVDLRLMTGGELFPDVTSFRGSVEEGFLFPGSLALVTCAVAGWSASSAAGGAAGTAIRAGLRTYGWSVGLAFVGLLAFAAARPEGLERYSVEATSAGLSRAMLYAGHQVLLAPNQAMWILSPSMGGCVTVRVGGRSHDVLCLDRIPRGDDPATWFLSELGRVRGSSEVAQMPSVARVFLLVPAAAVALGVNGVARGSTSTAGAAALGAGAGAVFALVVTLTSLAGSLWVVPASGNETTQRFAMGPDPVGTALLALGWGVLGGAAAAVAGRLAHRRRQVSGRARPR